MKKNYLLVNNYVVELAREVYWREEHHQPDYSLEYSESIEMTVSELAEQLVTNHANASVDVVRIPIDRSVIDFLTEVYQSSVENDDQLFVSFELSEGQEQFLYELGQYLEKGDYKSPFSI